MNFNHSRLKKEIPTPHQTERQAEGPTNRHYEKYLKSTKIYFTEWYVGF